MSTILKIDKLRKSYGKLVALNDLSLEVKQGEVFGLLGPNGSGKTTTLSILLGVIEADSGSFRWFENYSTYEARHRIGTLLEKPIYYPYLSARQNLEITALIKGKGMERVGELLDYVGLGQRMDSKVKTFSTGMKQRLAIAASLISDPDVLILDEPTNGLDPSGIAEVRELIVEISKTGKTIIMASHLLDEVEKVCTDVAVLKAGVLLEKRNLISHGQTDKKKLVELKAGDMRQLNEALNGMEGINVVKDQNGMLLVETTADPSDINRILMEQGIVLSHLSMRKKSLEEQFLEMTK